MRKPLRLFFSGLEYVLVLLVAFAILLPVAWIILSAFKTSVDTFSLRVFFIPTLRNFSHVLLPPHRFLKNLVNSFVVSGTATFISVILAIPAAYGFSRFRLFAKQHILFWIISLQFIPQAVILIPLFIFFRSVNLLDTRLCLIIIYLSIGVPLSIWILKGFMDDIPKEIEESAMVDGASLARILWDIVIPLAKPAIIVAAILSEILTINEFLFALVLTDRNAVTMPIGLLSFHTNYGILWEKMAAAGVLMMIPVFIFAFLIQKHLIRGLTLGAIK